MHTVENREHRVRGLDLGGGSSYDYLVESWGRGQRTRTKSLATCHNDHIFYLKHFLTNHKQGIGILATGCRITTSSSIYSIHYLPMVDGCPVVTNLVLLPMTIFVYHPITK